MVHFWVFLVWVDRDSHLLSPQVIKLFNDLNKMLLTLSRPSTLGTTCYLDIKWVTVCYRIYDCKPMFDFIFAERSSKGIWQVRKENNWGKVPLPWFANVTLRRSCLIFWIWKKILTLANENTNNSMPIWTHVPNIASFSWSKGI